MWGGGYTKGGTPDELFEAGISQVVLGKGSTQSAVERSKGGSGPLPASSPPAPGSDIFSPSPRPPPSHVHPSGDAANDNCADLFIAVPAAAAAEGRGEGEGQVTPPCRSG